MVNKLVMMHLYEITTSSVSAVDEFFSILAAVSIFATHAPTSSYPFLLETHNSRHKYRAN